MDQLRVDAGRVGQVVAAPLSYVARLRDAEFDADEMLIYGTPEQHKAALDKVDAIRAERDGATVRVLPTKSYGAWARESEQQARERAVRLALETSAERAAKAERMRRYWDWVSAEMGRQAKLTAREIMAEVRVRRSSR